MKILVIGDFHGEIPKNLKRIIKQDKINLIVSLGDYFPFLFRDIWFKHCYRKKTQLWEVIGKKGYKELMKTDLKEGEKVLKELNSFSIPVFTVIGNLDYTRTLDVSDPQPHKKWAWDEQDFFSKILKEYGNIRRFDYSYLKFGDLIFIGAYGGTFPGKVKSKNYKKYRKILDKLFIKFKRENEAQKLIFVSHNVPYETKIDQITAKGAHKKVKGKHYGSKLIRRIIEKYQPTLYIGGHIHEGIGMDKLGKSILLNPGSAKEGRFAIINFNEKTEKFNVKLKKI